MRFLIVNADDYGRTAAISAGIRFTHLNGLVTTTTAMMNFPTAEADLRTALTECPRLGLGVHLTLTAGRPVLPPAQIPTLVDAQGAFLKLAQLEKVYADINVRELKAEWRAQIEKFLTTGAALDHLDSHHHTSYFTQTGLGIMLDLAKEYNAPVRRPRAANSPDPALAFADRLLAQRRVECPDHFVTAFYDDGATLETLLKIVRGLLGGSTEIMSHPGNVDDEILRHSAYNRQREREIGILTDPAGRQAVADSGVALSTFRAALA